MAARLRQPARGLTRALRFVYSGGSESCIPLPAERLKFGFGRSHWGSSGRSSVTPSLESARMVYRLRNATVVWSAMVLAAVAVVTADGDTSPLAPAVFVAAAATGVWVVVLLSWMRRLEKKVAPEGSAQPAIPADPTPLSPLARLDDIPVSLAGRPHRQWTRGRKGVTVQPSTLEQADPDEAAAIMQALRRRRMLVGRQPVDRTGT